MHDCRGKYFIERKITIWPANVQIFSLVFSLMLITKKQLFRDMRNLVPRQIIHILCMTYCF
jgi:hypothetical protein